MGMEKMCLHSASQSVQFARFTSVAGVLSMEPHPLDDVAREQLNQITERIIGAAYKVLNELGCGFMEKVYENALSHELRKLGLAALQQQEILVHYDGIVVGVYKPDILVG